MQSSLKSFESKDRTFLFLNLIIESWSGLFVILIKREEKEGGLGIGNREF